MILKREMNLRFRDSGSEKAEDLREVELGIRPVKGNTNDLSSSFRVHFSQ